MYPHHVFQRVSSLMLALAVFTPQLMAYSEATYSEAGLNRVIQVLKPALPEHSDSLLKWVFISQHDLNGAPLPMISLASNDSLEIEAVTVNGHQALVTGSFRGNLFSGDQFLAFQEKRAAFFITIDAYGNASEPTILENTIGSLVASSQPSGDFVLLGYRYTDRTSLQTTKWYIGEQGNQKAADRREITDSDLALLEQGQFSKAATAPTNPVAIPIDNSEDPEG